MNSQWAVGQVAQTWSVRIPLYFSALSVRLLRKNLSKGSSQILVERPNRPERRNTISSIRWWFRVWKGESVMNKGNILHYSNGLSQHLAKLINRQASDFRLWRHQLKTGTNAEETSKRICLYIHRISHNSQHISARCQLMSGDLSCSTVFLLLASERWKKAGLKTGDTLFVHHPWYIYIALLL